MAEDPMQAFMAYATPGAEHAFLGHRLGRWELAFRVYHGPG